jgi:hypothetical protein
MYDFDPNAFHTALDERFGFIGFERSAPLEEMTSTPHQSKGPLVRFPGSSTAATELGVSRGHLHRVLTGERKSPNLIKRWNAWLKRNPQFASIQPSR